MSFSDCVRMTTAGATRSSAAGAADLASTASTCSVKTPSRPVGTFSFTAARSRGRKSTAADVSATCDSRSRTRRRTVSDCGASVSEATVSVRAAVSPAWNTRPAAGSSGSAGSAATGRSAS